MTQDSTLSETETIHISPILTTEGQVKTTPAVKQSIIASLRRATEDSRFAKHKNAMLSHLSQIEQALAKPPEQQTFEEKAIVADFEKATQTLSTPSLSTEPEPKQAPFGATNFFGDLELKKVMGDQMWNWFIGTAPNPAGAPTEPPARIEPPPPPVWMRPRTPPPPETPTG